jgi:hypothetical protein
MTAAKEVPGLIEAPKPEPVYAITGLTDRQWDRQLASQEKLRVAELENQSAVEMQRMEHQRRILEGRRQFVGHILVGIAVVAIVLGIIGALTWVVHDTNLSNQKAATECISKGGDWQAGRGGDSDKCDLPD